MSPTDERLEMASLSSYIYDIWITSSVLWRHTRHGLPPFLFDSCKLLVWPRWSFSSEGYNDKPGSPHPHHPWCQLPWVWIPFQNHHLLGITFKTDLRLRRNVSGPDRPVNSFWKMFSRVYSLGHLICSTHRKCLSCQFEINVIDLFKHRTWVI